MPLIKRPIGASGAALAVALLAAACGSGTSETVSAAGAEPSAEEPAAASSPTESEAADGPAEAEGPQPVIAHSFPDLDTVDISTGSTVNLASELSGGDTPILLWFFAPH